jgi:hypothetical protein
MAMGTKIGAKEKMEKRCEIWRGKDEVWVVDATCRVHSCAGGSGGAHHH